MHDERDGDAQAGASGREGGSLDWRRFELLDVEKLAECDVRLGRIAPVLNRAFTASLAVRAIAEAIGRGATEDGILGKKLAPLDLESLLAAIVMLSADLNRDVCQVVNFLDEAAPGLPTENPS